MLISFSVYLMQILNNGSDEDLLGLRLLHIFLEVNQVQFQLQILEFPCFFLCQIWGESVGIFEINASKVGKLLKR